MKKAIAIMSVLAILVCFMGCGAEETGTGTIQIPEIVQTQAPTETQPVVYPEISLSGNNVIDDVAEFKIVNVYITDDVMPPKVGSYYTHYEASNGNTYFVIAMDIKNLGTSAVRAEDLFSVKVTVENADASPNVLVEEEDGTNLENRYSVSPLETCRAHYLFHVPANSDFSSVPITIRSKDVVMVGTINADAYKKAMKTMKKGMIMEQEDVVSATLEDVFVASAVYPPNRSGYYSYFEAANGKTYLVVKFKVKNLKANDLKYESIAGVSCTYNGKYKYNTFVVFEEDGGQDLSSYSSLYSLAPLDTNTVYYLAEVPMEAQNGPFEIVAYIGGEYYTYNFG